jgi:hypothetical protein
MDGTEFARELIHNFGADRFYHCHIRMCRLSWGIYESSWGLRDCSAGPAFFEVVDAVHVYTMLGPPELPPWKCVEFFKSIGVQIDERLASTALRHPASIEWKEMCMVAYGFCKHWKEMGRKTPTLPSNLHARMILGEKNEWTEEYAREYLKEETYERLP